MADESQQQQQPAPKYIAVQNQEIIGSRPLEERLKGWVKEVGFPIAVAGYLFYKDFMFTEKVVEVMQQNSNLLQRLIDMHTVVNRLGNG